MQNNFSWSVENPNEKQKIFLQAKNRFIAYGGSRGGGKSWAVRKKAVALAFVQSGINILILRRTFPELRENHINPLKKELREFIKNKIIKYSETEKAMTFSNDSRIKFGYCDNENDVLQYQGQEYDVIFFDEATQFTEFQFKTITACMRGANNFPKRMYITCNPGGVGHGWVKRLFIDKDYKDGENAEDYLFIPARVYDNKALMQTDTGYVDMLKSLPNDLRRAWLEGDWNVLAGQYFSEWREEIHVCEPFEIPSHWRRYFTMDYGLDMLAAYVIAINDEGQAIVIKEFCQSGLVISEAAEKILQLCEGENIEVFYAPPDMWNRRQDTGKSVAELFCEKGIFLLKACNERVAGWLNMKEWLHTKGKEKPKLLVFKSCTELIKSIPLLLHEKNNPNDIAKEPHEFTHSPDAIRYFIAGRPTPKPPVVENDEQCEGESGQWNSILDFYNEN